MLTIEMTHRGAWVPLDLGTDVSLMASDGFHPGAGAYAAWAEQLALRVEAGDGQA